MEVEYMEHIGWRAARRRAKRRRRHADAVSELADAKQADQQAKDELRGGTNDDDQQATDDISPETGWADDWCRENIDNYDGRSPHEAMLAYCQAHGECLEYPTVDHFNHYLRKEAEYAEGGDNVISPYLDAAGDTSDIITRFIGTLEANKASFDYAEYMEPENWFFGLIPNKKKLQEAKEKSAFGSAKAMGATDEEAQKAADKAAGRSGDSEKGKGMMKWIVIALAAVIGYSLFFGGSKAAA